MSTKLKTIVLLVVSLLTLTACLPELPKADSKPPPGEDWFGNPLPTSDPVCNIEELNSGSDQVPPNPNPNIRTATITIQVYMTGSKAHLNGGVEQMCLPVALHVMGTVAGHPGIKIDDGTPGSKTLPWSGIRTTPWSATFVVEYDSSKIGSPVVNVDVIGTFSPSYTILDSAFQKAGVIQMDCNVKINGKSQKLKLDDKSVVRNVPSDRTSTVRCQFTISV